MTPTPKITYKIWPYTIIPDSFWIFSSFFQFFILTYISFIFRSNDYDFWNPLKFWLEKLIIWPYTIIPDSFWIFSSFFQFFILTHIGFIQNVGTIDFWVQHTLIKCPKQVLRFLSNLHTKRITCPHYNSTKVTMGEYLTKKYKKIIFF